MASSPKISVLLPVRDAADTLPACLQSLASQDFPDFEIIAVDHSSRDSSPEILEKWRDLEPRLRVLSSGAPSLPLALNEGLAQARGAYVARMDADDLCLPGRFSAQAALLDSDSSLGVVGCEVELFGDAEISAGYRNYEAWANALREPAAIARELFVECPLPHPGWLFRRELGLYTDDEMPEDYGFLLRDAEAGWRFAKPRGVLLRWREHGARHSRTHPRYGRAAFMRLRARYFSRLVLKGRPCVLWGAGDRGRLLARSLLDEGVAIAQVLGVARGKEAQPTSVHGLAVAHPESVKALAGPMIVCVGTPGVREEVRDFCAARGWIEGKDYWFGS